MRIITIPIPIGIASPTPDERLGDRHGAVWVRGHHAFAAMPHFFVVAELDNSHPNTNLPRAACLTPGDPIEVSGCDGPETRVRWWADGAPQNQKSPTAPIPDMRSALRSAQEICDDEQVAEVQVNVGSLRRLLDAMDEGAGASRVVRLRVGAKMVLLDGGFSVGVLLGQLAEEKSTASGLLQEAQQTLEGSIELAPDHDVLTPTEGGGS
jgi:hypothetical protein